MLFGSGKEGRLARWRRVAENDRKRKMSVRSDSAAWRYRRHPRGPLRGKKSRFSCCPEGSLGDYLRDRPNGRSDETQVRTWAIQIAEALAYARQRGAVHRDIEPGSILLDDDGKARLTDFGLSKAIGSEFILSQIHQSMQTLSMRETRRSDPAGAKKRDTASGGGPAVPQYVRHRGGMSNTIMLPVHARAVNHKAAIWPDVGENQDLTAMESSVQAKGLPGHRRAERKAKAPDEYCDACQPGSSHTPDGRRCSCQRLRLMSARPPRASRESVPGSGTNIRCTSEMRTSSM